MAFDAVIDFEHPFGRCLAVSLCWPLSGSLLGTLPSLTAFPQTHITSTKSFDRLRTTSFRRRNETLTTHAKQVQRQRRSATEPRVAPSGATLGYLFQIITNPEWGCALIHGSVRRNPFRVHGGTGWLTQGRRSFLAPTLGSVAQRRWRSMQSLTSSIRLAPESPTPTLGPTTLCLVPISQPCYHLRIPIGIGPRNGWTHGV